MDRGADDVHRVQSPAVRHYVGLVRDTRESIIDPSPWPSLDEAVRYYYLLDLDEGALGFPPNRGGVVYAASGWMAAIFSYSIGGSNPAELCRRRVL